MADPLHGFLLSLSLDKPVIEDVQGDCLWLRAAEDPFIIGIDARTGEQVGRLKSPGLAGKLEGARYLCSGGSWVMRDGQWLYGFDSADKWHALSSSVSLLALQDKHVFTIEGREGAPQLVLRDLESGEVQRAIPIPGKQDRLIPHAFVHDNLVVLATDDGQIVAIDYRRRDSFFRKRDPVLWTRAVPAGSMARRIPTILSADDKPWIVQIRSGGDTELSPIDLKSGDLEAPVQLVGEALILEGKEELVLAILRRSQGDVGAIVDTRTKRVLFETPLGTPSIAVATSARFAFVETGILHLLERAPQGMCWSRAPLPPEPIWDAALTNDRVCVAVEGSLISIPLPPPLSGGRRDWDLELKPISSRRSSSQPAKVIFSGSSLVIVDHPEYGRVTIYLGPDESSVAIGSLLYFDEVEVDPTATVKVSAWHRAGEASPLSLRSEPVLLSASLLPR